MTDLILNPARAQYAPALQENFIRGMAAFPAETLPSGLTSADLNILRRASPVFTPYALVSYGMFIEREGAAAPGIIATRDKPATTIIGDSGGFQFISKPELYQGRSTVLKALGWLQANADISMTVDIPTRAIGRSRWPTFHPSGLRAKRAEPHRVHRSPVSGQTPPCPVCAAFLVAGRQRWEAPKLGQGSAARLGTWRSAKCGLKSEVAEMAGSELNYGSMPC